MFCLTYFLDLVTSCILKVLKQFFYFLDKTERKLSESENSQDATEKPKTDKKDDDDDVGNPQFETAPASTEESQEDHTQVPA